MTSRTRRCDLFVATPHFLRWHDRKTVPSSSMKEQLRELLAAACCLLLAADIMRCVSPFYVPLA
jgi:hypothetical protein